MNFIEKIKKLYAQHRYAEVIQSCEAQLSKSQGSLDLAMLLGRSLLRTGSNQRAATTYAQALQQWPSQHEPYVGMAEVFAAASDKQQELAYLSKASELAPTNLNLALRTVTASLAIGQYSHAIKTIEQQRPQSDDDAEIRLKNIASLNSMLGRFELAFEIYEKLVESGSKDVEVYSQYAALLNYPYNFEAMRFENACNELNKQLCSSSLNGHNATSAQDINPNKVRIGFVSADLIRHSVSFFLHPLLANLDQDRFEVICYQNSSKHDAVSDDLSRHCMAFNHVEMLNDTQLVEQIKNDQIDILIDLSGHTVGHRLGVFAHRSAPIQCTYLGYPNVTGIENMDYRIVDSITDPESETETPTTLTNSNAEQLVRTARNFICFEGPEDVIAQDLECPEGKERTFVFGSFNNFMKITPETVELWSQVLNAVDNSQLALKCGQLFDEVAKQSLFEAFESHGIQRERLFLFPTFGDFKKHLAFYNQIDLALDTSPYNGTTTTCEALWMGVPTLTLCGDRHASRVGASILKHAGFDEFVANSEKQFVEIALSFAERYRDKSTPRQQWANQFKSSSMCDAQAFARDFESTLLTMVSTYNTTSSL